PCSPVNSEADGGGIQCWVTPEKWQLVIALQGRA
ncbi:hypothetical protein A2U01_0043838, partial [Trifolium medium]|nr:hypothetical protein [Trifolium medium]